MKLLLIISLFVCNAIIIPKPTSMQDLELLKPKSSVFNVIMNAFMHYRWLLSTIIFVSMSSVVLCIAWIFSKRQAEKNEAGDSEIYLEGRKLHLPEIEILKGKQRYFLSEDFEESPAINE